MTEYTPLPPNLQKLFDFICTLDHPLEAMDSLTGMLEAQRCAGNAQNTP